MLLKLRDVTIVSGELRSVQSKYKILGRLLNLPIFAININDLRRCLILTVAMFVEQEYLRPTWKKILEALRHPLLNEHHLAEEIEKQYCFPPSLFSGYCSISG